MKNKKLIFFILMVFQSTFFFTMIVIANFIFEGEYKPKSFSRELVVAISFGIFMAYILPKVTAYLNRRIKNKDCI
jgi:hypothetical protein